MKKIISSLLMFIVISIVPIFIVGCGNKGPYLSSIEVLRVEKRQGYKAFEKFDETNMLIRAYYSDGSFKNLTSGWDVFYVSADGQMIHNDCFYAGEDKVKIVYEGQSYIMSLYDKVEKINNVFTITIEEYAHIYNGTKISLPSENIKVFNVNNEIVKKNVELVYCTRFNNFDDYELTSSENGSVVVGGAPANAGTYKVFAKLNGGKNYKDAYSNVVEFNIFDETTTGLFSTNSEEFFGWKEITPYDNIYEYIEFKVVGEGENKNLSYSSTFAGSGNVIVFSDYIILINGEEKTQISLKNNKIYSQNNEIIFEKWTKPAYLGVYEMVISAQKATELKYETAEDVVCKLEIFVDETKTDGEVYFKLKCLASYTDALSIICDFEGKVTFVDEGNDMGRLTFIPNEGSVECVANNINKNQPLEKITLQFYEASSSKISAGEYLKK